MITGELMDQVELSSEDVPSPWRVLAMMGTAGWLSAPVYAGYCWECHQRVTPWQESRLAAVIQGLAHYDGAHHRSLARRLLEWIEGRRQSPGPA